MGIEQISAIILSDLHLGHRRTTTAHMVKSIDHWLIEHERDIISANMFIISGDVWDRLVNMLTSDIRLVVCVISNIMRVCATHGLVLRILEGTRLHDWGQSNIFQGIAEAYPTLDYDYVAHLSVEKHKGLGKTILYVPDDLVDERFKLEKMITTLLTNNGLVNADIGVIHTQFPYQLPDLGIDFGDPDFYNGIINDWVVSGHIHQDSTCGKIVTPGSFDILEHGQTRKKGGLLITHTKGDKLPKVKRLINSMPAIYKRIIVPKVNPEKYINKIMSSLKDLDVPVNVQLSGCEEHVVAGLLGTYKPMYPRVNFSKHKVKRKRDANMPSVKDTVRDVMKLQANILPAVIREHLTETNEPENDIAKVISLLEDIESEFNTG